jgi:hypothetical protein
MARKKTAQPIKTWMAGAAQAQRNLRQAVTLATGAGKVFTARTCPTPGSPGLPMDITEMARILPEKAVAFGAAGLLSLHYASQLGSRLAAMGSDEAVHARRQMQALAQARHPATFTAVLARGVWDFWQRAATQNLALATEAMRGQHAAIVPMARAVTRNTRRLKTASR